MNGTRFRTNAHPARFIRIVSARRDPLPTGRSARALANSSLAGAFDTCRRVDETAAGDEIAALGEDMKVRSYGKLADLLGAEREIEIHQACTVSELRAKLAAACPDAAESLASRRVRACVGDHVVPDSHVLAPGESIDLLAPVSGG